MLQPMNVIKNFKLYLSNFFLDKIYWYNQQAFPLKHVEQTCTCLIQTILYIETF